VGRSDQEIQNLLLSRKQRAPHPCIEKEGRVIDKDSWSRNKHGGTMKKDTPLIEISASAISVNLLVNEVRTDDSLVYLWSSCVAGMQA
jgi:hypothetical protein